MKIAYYKLHPCLLPVLKLNCYKGLLDNRGCMKVLTPDRNVWQHLPLYSLMFFISLPQMQKPCSFLSFWFGLLNCIFQNVACSNHLSRISYPTFNVLCSAACNWRLIHLLNAAPHARWVFADTGKLTVQDLSSNLLHTTLTSLSCHLWGMCSFKVRLYFASNIIFSPKKIGRSHAGLTLRPRLCQSLHVWDFNKWRQSRLNSQLVCSL